MARPSKPHRCSWNGEEVHGLYKCPDGRWRIVATGQKFTEADERKAVEKFRELTGQSIPLVTFTLSETRADNLNPDPAHDNAPPTDTEAALSAAITATHTEDGTIRFDQRIPLQKLYAWMRDELLHHPERAAKETGIRALATLDTSSAHPVCLEAIIEAYTTKSESRQNTRGHVESAIRKLMKTTGATTVADLTTQALIQFREEVVKQLAPTGAAAIFGKIKSGLSFARKVGMDANQIDAVLSRCKVMYSPKAETHATPHPITPDEFRCLLRVADARWRATLLVSLNMALYLADVSVLRWSDFDLDHATYTGQRNKTKIVRVGALWPETIAALKALSRTGSPYVFVSGHGSNYRSDSLHRQYATFREKAEATAPFSSIRDAAYTVAARSVDDRVARVFAAHASQGLMDAYVQRNPELVRPAADAVRKAFAPFPTPAVA